MAELYPEAEAHAQGWLMAGDGHAVYWEEAGNPNGIPALTLHGGPGSGSSPSVRRFFDPARYRIISFDQRNSGRSRPSAGAPQVDLSANTTWHLVADIERLRDLFQVEQWVIYGNSWGTTLALAYAQRHPGRVAAMVLQGVTTTRQSEIDWLYRGMGAQLSEPYAAFRAGVPAGTGESDLVAGYNDLMLDPDPAVHNKAAEDFHRWEAAMMLAEPGGAWPARWNDPAYRLARGRIVTHYFRHAAWLEPEQLMRGAAALGGIPGVLVQGRLDPQAPDHTAEELASAWPGVELRLIEAAGHSAAHADTGAAIVEALDRFASRYI